MRGSESSRYKIFVAHERSHLPWHRFRRHQHQTGVVQDGRIIARGNVIPTRQDGDTAALIQAIVQEILRLRDEYPGIEAVGFGVPGIIGPAAGIVVNLTNVKGWHRIPLRALVTERTGRVTNLENDAKAMAYAE